MEAIERVETQVVELKTRMLGGDDEASRDASFLGRLRGVESGQKRLEERMGSMERRIDISPIKRAEDAHAMGEEALLGVGKSRRNMVALWVTLVLTILAGAVQWASQSGV